MDATFLLARKTAWEAQLVALDAAILFLLANPTESYELDTGQSRQRVTRAKLLDLQNTYDLMFDRYSTFCVRISGASIIARASW